MVSNVWNTSQGLCCEFLYESVMWSWGSRVACPFLLLPCVSSADSTLLNMVPLKGSKNSILGSKTVNSSTHFILIAFQWDWITRIKKNLVFTCWYHTSWTGLPKVLSPAQTSHRHKPSCLTVWFWKPSSLCAGTVLNASCSTVPSTFKLTIADSHENIKCCFSQKKLTTKLPHPMLITDTEVFLSEPLTSSA